MTFLIGGVFVDFEGCSEVYMYFSFLLFILASYTFGLVTIYLHTLYFIFHI